ncbi:MAG TPA: GtrA family protein [Candidatus Parcubacteria bacterium]|nr:GtrA family protein [Candidatus Parcubacteria bacterium]
MKKLDAFLSLITGEGVGLLFVWLLKNSPNIKLPFLYWLLPIVFPLLALLAIWIAYLIGKKYLFVYQLAKFLLIGAFFAIFDLIILNFLLEYFGIAKEEKLKYSIFVTISFVVATTAKYLADKYWAFEQKEKKEMGREFSKFFIITLISGGIQVGTASLIFSFVSPFLASSIVAGNIGKIGGITLASAWNFLGYKFIVFKK